MECILRDAGRIGSVGVGLRQLVGMERLLLDEPEGGAQTLIDRRGAPVLPDSVPDLLAERIRRDRAVGAESEEALVEM
jgi:hypothetical protein